MVLALHQPNPPARAYIEQVKRERRAGMLAAEHGRIMWKAVGVEPNDQDLEVAVIDRDGAHPIVFPCRRIADGWIAAASRQRIDIRPTHWRPWREQERSSTQ